MIKLLSGWSGNRDLLFLFALTTAAGWMFDKSVEEVLLGLPLVK